MASKDIQSGLWDREIENAGLANALETLTNADNKAIMKRVTKARKLVKEIVEAQGLEDGERLRCGEFVIHGKIRGGGGIEVPKWEKVTAGRIETLR